MDCQWSPSWPPRAHATAIVTSLALPVRSKTVKVCLVCLWISADLEAEHG
jgi:hypothetical protein